MNGGEQGCPFLFIGDKFPLKRAIRTSRRLPTRASDSWRRQATAILHKEHADVKTDVQMVLCAYRSRLGYFLEALKRNGP